MDAQQSTSGPDITGLRIDESARNDRRGGRRLRKGLAVALAILIIAAAVLALRGRTPVVEVTTARPAGEAGGVILLNASGYVTPRRRATIAAKITALGYTCRHLVGSAMARKRSAWQRTRHGL